ncbi:hypothetical protein KKG83_03840 [Candidatus Micrarchaeota archaeon]|nr:hypothetical protein [Candidatus Micrarchaeota archaeon]MBU2476577.1 hypothetical protein [Candidatus Micrarchaeota archaeon]
MTKKSSTSEQIIEILSNEWPLTTKQIHHRLKRNYASIISYQAVHKHLKEMLKDKMIVKDSQKILLSYSYIKKLSDYAKRLESSFGEVNGKDSKMIMFGSLVGVGRFAVNEFNGNASGKYPNPENKDFVCMWNHAWPLIGVSQEEHETMKRTFSETVHWNICKNNTYLDNLTSNYLKNLGKNIAMNKEFSMKNDTMVGGNYVMQIFFPLEFEKEMEKIYKKIKTEKDFDIKELFEFTTKHYEIKTIIFKNQQMADSLREEAKKICLGEQKIKVKAKK